ncbi:hypothetical protein QE412_001049 [Microbacterium trichothecenolyticum]|uniref:Uncharacterized protein n=1 Tax=Microbacterium trichothecenolyticum TaxID=69370 RepID=A0ABU0TS36_MICTR|nr:hypothetical protein [Microbacterium trichothecenolyticum]
MPGAAIAPTHGQTCGPVPVAPARVRMTPVTDRLMLLDTASLYFRADVATTV